MLRSYEYLGSSDKRMIQGRHQSFINTWRGDKLAYATAAAVLLEALARCPKCSAAPQSDKKKPQKTVKNLIPEGFLSTMNPHSSK